MKSYEYSKGCNPQEQQYISDAFGTLVFGAWGGIGYSYTVYKMQNNGIRCL